MAPELADFLRDFPSAIAIAALEMRSNRFQDLHQLGAWGVSQVISLEFDTTTHLLRARLDQAIERSLQHVIASHLAECLPADARAIVDAAIVTALERANVSALARRLHVSTRTLDRRCARGHLPAPRFLLRWARLILAARYLDDPGRTVYEAALAIGYSSDAALRRALQHSGLPSPRQLRCAPVFETVMGAFVDLVTGASSE